MAINGYTEFTYVGYTLGGEKPTLYFAEGRYTQEHEILENIGWHPNPPGDCVRINITEEAADLYLQIEDNEIEGFAKEVIKGTYNATAGGVLCECHIKNGIFHGIHVSRGRLIRLADSNFEKTYSKEYATKVLAIGELAPNEKK